MKLNILASWAHLQGMNWQDYTANVAKYCNLMIDSGGFTDYWARIKVSIGHKASYTPISLDEYMQACKYFESIGADYIALDFIRDEEQTMKNLNTMTDAGLRPIPIFVEGGTHSNLAKMKNIHRKNIVCVPGAARVDKKYFHDRIRRVKSFAPWANIHALGYFRLPDILKLPVYSSDSTTWVDAQRYGSVFVFNGYKFSILKKGLEFAKYCKPEDLKVRKYWMSARTYGNAITMLSFIKAILYCYNYNLHFYMVECPDYSQLVKVITATLIANNYELDLITMTPDKYQDTFIEIAETWKRDISRFWLIFGETLYKAGLHD
jgi:hypothetical protein